MDSTDVRELLEAMSTEDIKINVPYATDLNFGTGIHPVEGAKYQEVEARRVFAQEYALGAYMDEVDASTLWRAMVRKAIIDMPAPNCKLFWRVYPEYERDTEFSTGRERHKVYFRLGWMKEW